MMKRSNAWVDSNRWARSARLVRALSLAAVSLALLPASQAGAVVDLDPGVTQVQFSWTEASGPVTGYFVYASVNGGSDVLLHAVPTTSSLPIEGSPGDTLSVRVIAFESTGSTGPYSNRSETVRFNAVADPAPAPEPDPQPAPEPDATTDPDPIPEPDPAPAPGAHTQTSPDFDANGSADLLVRNAATEQMRMWAMAGASIAEDRILARLGAPWEIVGNGDYDGDGTSDVLLWNRDTGRLDVWLIDDLSLVGGSLVTANLDPWQVSASGDFDGDGADDVVVFDPDSNTVAIWALMKGEVQTLLEIPAVHGPDWQILGAGDYNGDGLDDLLWSDGGQQVEVWLMDARVGVLAANDVSASKRSSWDLAGIGDFDADGRDDLVWRDSRRGTLRAWMMNGGQVTRSTSLSPGVRTSAFDVVGTGDYDGDGPDDLLLRGRIEGTLVIAFMENGQVRDTAQIDRLADEWTVGSVGSERPRSSLVDDTTSDSDSTNTGGSRRELHRR